MRLFQAFANMWRGFVSLFIRRVAVANPEMAYEGIIQKRKEEREKLIQAVGVLGGEKQARERDLARMEQELSAVDRELKAAVGKGNQRVAVVLIKKKETLDRSITGLRPRVLSLQTEYKKRMSDVERFNASIIELKEKARIKIAELRGARATNRILQMFDGLSIEGDEQMVQAIDEAVDAEVGAAQVRSEIDSATNVDRELAEVRKEASQGAADDEYARLRAQFEQEQGVAPAGGNAPTDGGGKQA